MALSDSGSFRGDAVSTRLRPHDGAFTSRPSQESSFEYDIFNSRASIDSSQPEAIEETSEPDSPLSNAPVGAASVAGRPQSGSALTHLLRSSPPEGPTSASTTDQGKSGRVRSRESPPVPEVAVEDTDDPRANEQTSLLPRARLSDPRRYGAVPDGENGSRKSDSSFHPRRPRQPEAVGAISTLLNPRRWNAKAIVRNGIVAPLTMLPAVFLGLLLNVLDALSYG